MSEHIDSETGEVLPAAAGFTDLVNQSLAIGLARTEIDTQIATAKQFPRDLQHAIRRLRSYVTLDEETAEECMYALPRGGKAIKGPSIRFAEALKASFGNCRAAARVVFVDRVEKVVIAEGVFHDLETNSASRSEVRRRIVDKRGNLFNDDMIIMTGNAAASIALRNAILGGVPKPVWRRAYEEVQRIIAGDIATLAETRSKAVKAMATFGVTPEQVFKALGVAGELDITIDHIPIVRGMFAALKNGESTVEEMFPATQERTGKADIAGKLNGGEKKEAQSAPDKPEQAGTKAEPAQEAQKPAQEAQGQASEPGEASKAAEKEAPASEAPTQSDGEPQTDAEEIAAMTPKASEFTDDQRAVLSNLTVALGSASNAEDLAAIPEDFGAPMRAHGEAFEAHCWDSIIERADKLGYDWPEGSDAPTKREQKRGRGRPPKAAASML